MGVKRERETPEYAAMVRRIIAAHGRRCADADPIDLVDLVELHQAVESATHVAIDGMRARGHSWADIARELGMTRQGAQQWHARFTAAAAARQA